MDLRDIEYFAVIAEHRHLGRAAEALGLGQPALSISLRRLEKAAGAKLVNRTPKGVELTAVGAALLSHVRRLRLARDDLAREVADLAHGTAGHLRIGVITGLPEDIAGAAGRVLLKEAPKATLRISVVNTEALLPALRMGEFDLAISNTPGAPSEDLAHEHLLDDEFIVYASVDHPLAGRKRLKLTDVAQQRWVTVTGASGFSWQALREVFERNGLTPPRIAVESNSTTVRSHAVASSEVLGFSSRPVVKQAATRFGLKEVPVEGFPWRRRLGVIYRKDAYLSPAAKRFIEILKTTAKVVASEKP